MKKETARLPGKIRQQSGFTVTAKISEVEL
jgi:hypothetical protein